MGSKTWIDVVLALIAALPGGVAAWSSIKNGRTLKNGATSRPAPRKSKKEGDWYRPPNFDE